MEEGEALALIDRLSDLIVEERFIYRHRWAVGDLLMWDNPAVQHIAIRDYEWPQRRSMWRTTVQVARATTLPVRQSASRIIFRAQRFVAGFVAGKHHDLERATPPLS